MARITKDELEARITKAVANRQAFPYLEVHCPYALARLDELIKAGQDTHGPMDWQDIGVIGNLEHSEGHQLGFYDLTGENRVDTWDVETTTDHLLNATCRMIMALELREIARDLRNRK